MLEYLLTILLIIVSIFYIIKSFRRKSHTRKSRPVRSFGKWIPISFQAPLPVPYPDWSIEKTCPLLYRPFKYGPDYFITMGIRRLDWNDWIELDNEWKIYHKEKLSRLSQDRASDLCKTAPEAYDGALETMELLSQYLVHRYPSLFQYEFNDNEKQIRIKATGEIYPIKSDDPLKYASLLIQDDLAIMIEGSDGQYYLKAGSITIPGFWRLRDKFNMPLAQIHISGDVPKFQEKLQHSMERYFQRMSPEHPVIRHNYFIQTDGELAWSSSIGPEDTFGIGWQNAKPNPSIEKIHFRSERQTLRRLPRSGAILFTIRPYFIPIVEMVKEAGVPGRLASAIRSWPDDVARYKGKIAYEDVLLKYLDEQQEQQCKNGIEADNSKSYPY
ncbi:unnamed protein product [Rotaria magnacalcarata]|uniref:DUF3445 domain-containing protein n=1 Tax=Rotaria magnacalcarata TaxID=392030 RepID=A0A814JJZ7_9BILA|nr:unnamed protein product [Rotaria magnacalcarata]CAF1617411.1 unnamed protein product [Rotaria magnacalcarata]CAF2267188.1 unnamed protein product [Rotaria magnacalcarata]CAF3802549.1 unnamed protein product [Rotaria magnacalcarata]CAF3970799.1 unnamed protein product [Rotaria magnacalcarata]